MSTYQLPGQEQKVFVPVHRNWFRDLPKADYHWVVTSENFVEAIRKDKLIMLFIQTARYKHQAPGGHHWGENCQGNKTNMEENRAERCR